MSDSAAAVPGAVRFAVSTEPVLLPIESAVPAGMILVELVSNVLKYAYPTDAGGAATVSLSEAGGRVALTVEDQGCGLPPGFDSASARSFGWQLIRQLAEQLNGAVTVAGGTGTRVRLDFPASPASPVEPQSPPRA
jgi:two-component sensor histidine kinase